MITKLIACALTFFIGNPVCWCCVLHPALMRQVTEEPACSMCQQAETDAHDPGVPHKDESCPCAQSCSDREFTYPDHALSFASDSGITPILWARADAAPAPPSLRHAAIFRALETGPPDSFVPLYHWHCALLI